MRSIDIVSIDCKGAQNEKEENEYTHCCDQGKGEITATKKREEERERERERKRGREREKGRKTDDEWGKEYGGRGGGEEGETEEGWREREKEEMEKRDRKIPDDCVAIVSCLEYSF
jgi:hypothetical protein